MTNKQLDMIRDHMNSQQKTMSQMILAGFAGVGYMFHRMDKEIDEIKQTVAEIKQLIAQSNASK